MNVGFYVVVDCEPEVNLKVDLPCIARIDQIINDRTLMVTWLYHPSDPRVPKRHEFARNELLISDYEQEVEVRHVRRMASVKQGPLSGINDAAWFWTRKFWPLTRKVKSI